MSPNSGGNATTRSLPLFSCKVALTATSGQSVRSGLGDSTVCKPTDSGDSADPGSDDEQDRDLSPNRFDIEDRDAADELAADQYAEKVARQWGTPEGEWWP